MTNIDHFVQKVTAPQTFITAHMAKIYGIDWSYTEEGELVTCSEDKQVKVNPHINGRDLPRDLT